MIWIKQFTLILAGALLINNAHAEEKWVADEIFLQMSEMRKEIGQLKEKVAGLEQKIQDSQPKQMPIQLQGSENMTLGKTDATIAIIEFSDYECPFCSKHYKNVLPKLRERFIDKGKVKYIMKDFPLDFHAHAKKASLATRCAGEQGQYWRMHDVVFDARGVASEEVINDVAKQNKLDIASLKKCLEDPGQMHKLESDIALGAQLGVNGTPAFFVGRIKDEKLVDYQRLVGMQSVDTFAGIIESLTKSN